MGQPNDLVELANDVSLLAFDAVHERADMAIELHKAAANFLARACQSLTSVVLLAPKGLVGDAMAVMRTVIELDIDLAFIAKQDTSERLAAFLAYEPVPRSKLASAVSTFLGMGDPQQLAALQAKSDLAKAALRAKPSDKDPGNWAGVDIAERARRTDREKSYRLAYVPACSASHSGYATLLYARMADEAGADVLQWGATEPDDAPISFACMGVLMMIDTFLDAASVATSDPLRTRLLLLIDRLNGGDGPADEEGAQEPPSRQIGDVPPHA